MTPENGLTEPGIDYSGWVVDPRPPPTRKRWCPTHRRWEINPGERLRCGAAWAELYKMEQEAEMQAMGANMALVKLAENIGNLVNEMRYGDVIAEPPPRPPAPRPPTPPTPPTLPVPPSRNRNGKGGVALP